MKLTSQMRSATPDAHILAGEDGAEVDFSPTDTDSAALRDEDGAVVEGIVGDLWGVVYNYGLRTL
jgi:hypothetical protein